MDLSIVRNQTSFLMNYDNHIVIIKGNSFKDNMKSMS
jgi:hypothetical protein